MAATTISAILEVWRAVLAAPPLNLAESAQPFDHDRQPNLNIADTYCIQDGGPVSRTSQTNHLEARIDRLVIFIAKPLAFAGARQFATMEELFDEIYRYLLVRARTEGWNVEPDHRRVTQPKGTELMIGEVGLRVDFDFSSAAS